MICLNCMLNDCIVSESIVSESSLTRQLANMGLLSHNQVVSVCLSDPRVQTFWRQANLAKHCWVGELMPDDGKLTG